MSNEFDAGGLFSGIFGLLTLSCIFGLIIEGIEILPIVLACIVATPFIWLFFQVLDG